MLTACSWDSKASGGGDTVAKRCIGRRKWTTLSISSRAVLFNPWRRLAWAWP